MTVRGEAIGAGGVVIAAIVTAWLALWGKKTSSPAETQEEINHGFSKFMRTANEKIEALEVAARERESRIEHLEGEMRDLRQYNQSLIRILTRNRLKVPAMRKKSNGVIALPATKA